MDIENQANQQSLHGNIQLLDTDNSGGGISSEQYKTRENTSQTLDEPLRDLKQIGFKLKYVLVPKNVKEGKGSELRNQCLRNSYNFIGDLWGPLLLCLLLALTLTVSHTGDGGDMIFATIFVVIWVGAFIVTLNAKLLGGKISCFQSVCVLGYCIFPLNISAFICAFIGNSLFLIKLSLVVLSFGWSTYSSTGFMAALVSEDKRILAVYPVFLFYLFLSWYCLIVE